MDPMISTAALAAAERLVNTALDYDPATRQALANLAPQVLAVQLRAPEFRFYLVPGSDGLALQGHYEGDITTQISGTPAALMSLVGSNRLNLKDTGVEVIGSTQLLADLQQLLKQLDLDWEELLSQCLGDLLGHQAAEFLRGQGHWVQDRLTNLQRLTREFLTEELRSLPSKAELAFFNDQVDEVRFAVDRLEARLSHLFKQQESHQ